MCSDSGTATPSYGRIACVGDDGQEQEHSLLRALRRHAAALVQLEASSLSPLPAQH